ncbi:MAG TPA: glycine/sarcosine/betaine reductase component B subunit [Chloroflexota bacterium]
MSGPAPLRLELGTFPVEDAAFGGRTRWSDGRLEIDRAEVVAAIRRDPRVLSAELELLRPGDSVRVVNVRDLIEPRVKVEGPGVCYPGICGRPNQTVGEGRTHRLAGLAIVESADAVMYDGNDGWLDRWLDLDGPVAEAAPTGRALNLALVLRIVPGLAAQERSEAAHRAALELNDRLAGATAGLTPPELTTYELAPPRERLPKVVYIACLRSPQHYAGSLTATWVSIYGLTRLTPPWLLHPNELLDGAIGGPASSHSATTSWVMVNNPIMAELYRGHGRDHDFVGAIAIRTRWSAQEEKELTAYQAAKLARLLGAEGAVITYDAGGNDFMEVIQTVQACERLGVKTVFVTTESPPEAEGPPLLMPLPEADAIVSTGIGRPGRERLAVPPPARVLGGHELMATAARPWERIPADAALDFHRWSDHYGLGTISCIEH